MCFSKSNKLLLTENWIKEYLTELDTDLSWIAWGRNNIFKTEFAVLKKQVSRFDLFETRYYKSIKYLQTLSLL